MPHKIESYLCDYSCPVEATLDVIGGKWKAIILYYLMEEGVLRYNAILRKVQQAPRRTLTRQLRELEQFGVIQRKIYAEMPPRVEYSLTAFGASLAPMIRLMRDWGSDNIQHIIAYRAASLRDDGQHEPVEEEYLTARLDAERDR